MTLKQYTSPTGSPIIGIVEQVEGTAVINGFTPSGEPIYASQFDADWDTQEPKLEDGRKLYVAEDGFRYHFNQLVEVPTEPSLPETAEELLTFHITPRERDTTLAALRYWQWEQNKNFPSLRRSHRGRSILDIATNDRKGDDASLTNEEIDDLCERINI